MLRSFILFALTFSFHTGCGARHSGNGVSPTASQYCPDGLFVLASARVLGEHQRTSIMVRITWQDQDGLEHEVRAFNIDGDPQRRCLDGYGRGTVHVQFSSELTGESLDYEWVPSSDHYRFTVVRLTQEQYVMWR